MLSTISINLFSNINLLLKLMQWSQMTLVYLSNTAVMLCGRETVETFKQTIIEQKRPKS